MRGTSLIMAGPWGMFSPTSLNRPQLEQAVLGLLPGISPHFLLGVIETLCHVVQGLELCDAVLLRGRLLQVQGQQLRLL